MNFLYLTNIFAFSCIYKYLNNNTDIEYILKKILQKNGLIKKTSQQIKTRKMGLIKTTINIKIPWNIR